MPIRPHRKKKFTQGEPLLDAVTAEWLSLVEERLNRLEKFDVLPPLHKDESGFGTILSTDTTAGGGIEETIDFTIVSVDLDANPPEALVEILSRSCGLTSVTGESGGQVTVVDRSGCLLDEPEADLPDRYGWAKYMQPDGSSTCEWRMFMLCCKPCADSSSGL